MPCAELFPIPRVSSDGMQMSLGKRFVRCAAAFKQGTSAMYMSNQGLLITLVIGVLAGWLAGILVRGSGFGLIGDLIIGIIGAFIGGWLLPRLGIHLGIGFIAAVINATLGAAILLIIIRLVRGGGGGWRNRWR